MIAPDCSLPPASQSTSAASTLEPEKYAERQWSRPVRIDARRSTIRAPPSAKITSAPSAPASRTSQSLALIEDRHVVEDWTSAAPLPPASIHAWVIVAVAPSLMLTEA